MVVLHTLIGDVVDSRSIEDRAAFQDHLATVLDQVTAALRPEQPLETTVGDELQGAFTTVSDAVLASLLIRLALLPAYDLRCGLGHGEVAVWTATAPPGASR